MNTYAPILRLLYDANCRILSTMPIFLELICFKNFGGNAASDPNSDLLEVSESLVWESKDGFSMSVLTKTHRNCLTAPLDMALLFLFFFATSFTKWVAIWSVI